MSLRSIDIIRYGWKRGRHTRLWSKKAGKVIYSDDPMKLWK